MRLALTIAAALAACTPAVVSSSVEAIDDRGDPIARLAIPVQPIGGSTVLAIKIANLGQATASPIALALAGDVASDFTIDGGCAGVALESGMTCALQLTFRAMHEGKLTAALDITTDDLATLELETDVFKPQP